MPPPERTKFSKGYSDIVSVTPMIVSFASKCSFAPSSLTDFGKKIFWKCQLYTVLKCEWVVRNTIHITDVTCHLNYFYDAYIDIIYHVYCVGYLSNLHHESQSEAVIFIFYSVKNKKGRDKREIMTSFWLNFRI